MGTLIDFFTRQAIRSEPQVRRVSQENDARSWFKEFSGHPEDLSEDEQRDWIVMFHEFYLQSFFDCVEGIQEAQNISDLEHWLSCTRDEMRKWPKR